MMTDIDTRTMNDSNASPLDLSVKSSRINGQEGNLAESLKQLILLQSKISLPQRNLSKHSPYSNSINDSPTPALLPENHLLNSREWLGLCQNPYVMNQMLAKLGNLGNCNSLPSASTTETPLDMLKSPFEFNKHSMGKRKFLPNRFKCESLMHTVAPPEAFGISMRGNQKYSAYYQRPFVFPYAASAKQGVSQANHLKKSTILEKKHQMNGKEKAANNTSVKETAFQCSCGEEFENLYIFTLHMKESNHSPKLEKNERDIPKLVRGQDMWINSEIEQTREILRCMHCQQSFRTLPDLTMHMIKTNHFSEIVYSDSGRCVFLNSDHSSKHSDNSKIGEKRSSQHLKACSPALKSSTKCSALRPRKMPRLKMEEPIEKTPRNDDQMKTPPNNEQCASIYCDVLKNSEHSSESSCCTKPDSSSKEYISEKSEANSFSSVISQIESFVEKSLPKTTPKFKNASIKLLDSNKNCIVKSKQNGGTIENSDNRSYIAPEETDKNDESPLSSLQKLVDTTSNANRNSLQSQSPSNKFSQLDHKEQSYSSSKLIDNSHVSGLDRPSSSLANEIMPSFLMLNSAQSPQDQLSLLSSLYSLYPAIVQGIPHDLLKRIQPYASISDSPQNQLLIEPSGGSSDRTENATKDARSNVPTTGPPSGPPLSQVKKSKCNYCGKPFANKGQVRLHVSKGKCPSLMQSCHSTSLASAMLSANPFSYLSLGRG